MAGKLKKKSDMYCKNINQGIMYYLKHALVILRSLGMETAYIITGFLTIVSVYSTSLFLLPTMDLKFCRRFKFKK